MWTARSVFPIEKRCETSDTVPGELVGLGANILNAASSYLGTYLQLLARMREPGFDPSGWQSMYR